jgi:hypothetical protein
VFVLGLAAWMICSLPVAVLVGYCALGEEKYGSATPQPRQQPARVRPISIHHHHHLARQHPVERPEEPALAPSVSRPFPLDSHRASQAAAPQ